MGKFAKALYPGQEEVTAQLHCDTPIWLDRKGTEVYAARLEESAENCHKELGSLGVIAASSSVMIYKDEMHARLTAICKNPEHHRHIETLLRAKLSMAFNYSEPSLEKYIPF